MINTASNQALIVVPCYNEAKRLNVRQFRDYLAQSDSAAIVFVDDGSGDDTLAVLEDVCRGYEARCEIVRCSKNRGKAEAVRAGLRRALEVPGVLYVGYWDADLATPLSAIRRFITVLEDMPAIAMVFGSRVKLLGRQIRRKAQRHYLGRVFATTVSKLLQLEIYDTQCGAKLFRADSGIRKILDQPFLSRWVFDVELIARYLALYRGNSKVLAEHIYEYPLESWEDIGGSKVRPKDFVIAFVDVLRIRRKYLK